MGLDEWIRARKVSGSAFAARVGISPSFLSRLRAGDAMPSLAVALRIERATNNEVSCSEWAPGHPVDDQFQAAGPDAAKGD